MPRVSTLSIRARALAAALAVCLGSAATSCQAAAPSQLVEEHLMVAMRDGVRLATDIYRPANGTAPAVLIRTPYNKDPMAGAGRALARMGYAAVVQDVRGRFHSEGDFGVFPQEGPDGYDTIEWLAKQPWCTGKVGMFGGSYLGIVQWAAAMAQPPHLTCIFPIVAPSDYFEQVAYQDGALRQELIQNWLEAVAAQSPWWEKHSSNPPDIPGLNSSPSDWLWHLPLSDPGPIAKGGPAMVAFWKNVIDHPTEDAFWRQFNPEGHYDRIKVPAFISGGWYDIFDQGCVDNFTGMRAHAGSAVARANTHLLMGPYPHAMQPVPFAGAAGPHARVDLNDLAMQWFDYWLKGKPNGVDHWSAAHTYVMGEDRWVDRSAWPPSGEHPTAYFLADRVGSRTGGTLAIAPPGAEAPSAYTYDPHRPVPTLGGNNLTVLPGPQDQTTVEARQDVLLFSTPPLRRPVHVAGRVQVRLYAAASTPDTDFTAKLVDVDAQGTPRNVLDGILRGRFRTSLTHPRQIVPGHPALYVIDLWSTEKVFPPGHRIRLEISSSNFPRFNRNLNTGEPTGRGSTMRTAHIQVFHDRSHPSALVLPVVSN